MNSTGDNSARSARYERSKVPERLCRVSRVQGTGSRGHRVHSRGFKEVQGHGHHVCLYSVYSHACVHVRLCMYLHMFEDTQVLHMCIRTFVPTVRCAGSRCLCWCVMCTVCACIHACVHTHLNMQARALLGEGEGTAKPVWWRPGRVLLGKGR